MAADIVLFLRDPVPHDALLSALDDVFGFDEEAQLPLIVEYAEGFATGVGMEVHHAIPVREAVGSLSARLGTEVLLELGGEPGSPCWLLFLPDARQPVPVQPMELRHGLTVDDRVPASAVYPCMQGSRGRAEKRNRT